LKGSTYIPYDEALKKGLKLLSTGKNPNLGLLIVCGINLGLRISDLKELTYGQLNTKEIVITEKKTGKQRTLTINPSVRLALSYHISSVWKKDEYKVFTTQKGSVPTTQHVNRLLKKVFPDYKVSSHSLRKSFGRQVYNNNGKSENALVFLSEIFQHSSLAITRKYLGIRDEEIKNIYLNL